MFAPTDEAFAALPEGTVAMLLKPENKDQLVAILTYHVLVPGRVYADQVVTLDRARTVQGQNVRIRSMRPASGSTRPWWSRRTSRRPTV